MRFLVCALAVFAFIGSVLAISDVTVYPGVCIRPDNNVTIVTGNTFHWSDLNVYSSYAEMGSVKVYPSCPSGQANMTLYSLSNRSAVFNVAPVSPVSIRFDWPTTYPIVMNISGRLVGNQSLPAFDHSSKSLTAYLNATPSSGVYVDVYCPSGFSPSAVYVEGCSLMHVSGQSDLLSKPRGWYKSGSSLHLKFSAACPDKIVVTFSSAEEAPPGPAPSPPWTPPVILPEVFRGMPGWLVLLLLGSIVAIIVVACYWAREA